MPRKSRSQRESVNGDGVGDMALANDAATGSAQGEMNLPSLLRLRVADLPSLFFGKDQIQPRVFHYKQHLCRTAQGTPLTTLLTSLPLLLSSREAVSAEFCPTGSSIIPATWRDAFITSLGFHLRRTAQGTPLTTLLTSLPLLGSSRLTTLLTSQSLLRSSRHVVLVVRCVALVAKDSFGTCVAFVAKDSFATCSRGVAAKHFPFRICTRRTSPEAFSAEFCPTGSSIIPATWLAAFITSLGICFHHGSDGRA